MRKTNKKLVNLMMAGVMAAGVIMAPASTFAAKTCNICGYKFDTWYNMVWMEKIIGEHQKKQPAMITFPELLKKDPTPWEA